MTRFAPAPVQLLAATMALVFLLPFLWAISLSLKPPHQLLEYPPRLVPWPFDTSSFVEVWAAAPLLTFFKNTFLLSGLRIAAAVLSGSLVAYGFARFRFPGRRWLFLLVLSTMMMPPAVTLVPEYLIFKWLGWIDTLEPLWVPAWFGGSAFTVFLFRQYLMTIPMDLDEAARIDGAGPLQVFFLVLLPLVKPVIAAVTVLTFLHTWNDFLRPVIYLSSTEHYTIPLGLRFFASHAGVGSTGPMTGLLMAAALLATLPVVAIFVAAQRHFIQGIALTGVNR